MKKELTGLVKDLKLASNIKGMALVTKDWSEIFFYSNIDGEWHKSLDMVEEGLIDSVKLDNFTTDVEKIIRSSSQYKMDKLNIIKFDNKGNVFIEYDKYDISVYSVKKKWRKALQFYRFEKGYICITDYSNNTVLYSSRFRFHRLSLFYN